MKTALYPGTFDPVTLGHVDLVERGLQLFDRIVVAVADNPGKAPLFPLAERVRLFEEATSHLEGVVVTPFQSLTVEFAKERRACAIIRGLRAISDFDYEFQLAWMNRKLAPGHRDRVSLPERAILIREFDTRQRDRSARPQRRGIRARAGCPSAPRPISIDDEASVIFLVPSNEKGRLIRVHADVSLRMSLLQEDPRVLPIDVGEAGPQMPQLRGTFGSLDRNGSGNPSQRKRLPQHRLSLRILPRGGQERVRESQTRALKRRRARSRKAPLRAPKKREQVGSGFLGFLEERYAGQKRALAKAEGRKEEAQERLRARLTCGAPFVVGLLRSVEQERSHFGVIVGRDFAGNGIVPPKPPLKRTKGMRLAAAASRSLSRSPIITASRV